MKNRFKLPVIILAVGVIMCVVACLLTGILKTPTITQHDFHYSATYQLNGETKTLEGIYRCEFVSTGKGIDPQGRYYKGYYPEAPDQSWPDSHILARKGDQTLELVFIFSDAFLMGDGYPGDTYSDVMPEPYLAVYTSEGYEYSDEESLAQFDAQLLSWEMPEAIENDFVFAGFSILHSGSMLAMLLVGILTILACAIAVKKEQDLSYSSLDKLSVVLNFLVGLVALPFITLVVSLMPIYVSGEELIYQIDLCVPALTAFAIAASIALRRKGFAKTGLCIQFAGPVLFILLAFAETFV